MQTDVQREYVEYVSARLTALRRLAYLLCGDEHRADDLVQQAITKLYVQWRRISLVEHLDQYVRTMVVRAFLDERRRPWSRVGLTNALPERASPDHHLEESMVLRAALAQVPRRQQAVLVLRFLCDLPVDEVASVLNCSTGTVKSQTSRGLANLRRLLEDQDIPVGKGS